MATGTSVSPFSTVRPLSPHDENTIKKPNFKETIGYLVIIVTMAAMTVFAALTSFLCLSPNLLGGLVSSNILLGLSASLTIGFLVIFCIRACNGISFAKDAKN